MNETDIRKYAGLMQELGLTGLEITEDKNKVRLERTVSTAESQIVAVNTVSAPANPTTIENADYISIKSPIVGVFYAASAENAAPYVSLGDSVKKGQTLCLIEAMKLMNEITAEDDGVISEICVTNGQVVEFGTELFRIKR
ncbi:MAG: acetyl-CoA carboxylase, biotin carboxyl carrier protein [Clostridia bacterium]|nr:acetyl-CoA carboxylase, biotin carboxyl carrier protein [Clostridia bacterium]